nr:hypothetical protein [Tanacetum cinerariifolium]
CYLRNLVIEIVKVMLFTSQQMVFNSPCLTHKKELIHHEGTALSWLVQKQTAFGKDTSNPLMAENLPKIVWFSTHHITCMKSWLVQKQTDLGQTTTGKESSNPFMAGSLPETILYFFFIKYTFMDVDAEEEVQVPAQDDVVQEHVIEEIATEVVPPTPTSPLPSSPVIPSTTPYQSPSPPQPQAAEGSSQLIQQGRHADTQAEIYNIDLHHSSKVLSMHEDTEVQEAVEVVTTTKLITEVVTTAATQVAAASTSIPAAKPAAKPKMEKEDEEIIKSINETPAQKAAKRRKLSEEAQKADNLRGRLEIVQDKDDDVFVKAIPLAQKVPIVYYQVVVIDNKPRYKIIRADDTHQFYISFITLLKNFDREDLETLWRIVKDRFSTKKPTNR